MINNKPRVVIVICTVLVLGLFIGLTIAHSNISRRVYFDVEANLVHAYFKVYNASADSGIGYSKLVSYVVILNVSNPTEDKLRITNARMDIDIIADFSRDYTNTANNYLMPHTSTLIALSQTGPTSEFEIQGLIHNNIQFLATVSCIIDENTNSRGGTIVTIPELHVKNISEDEFVWGSTFGRGDYFTFDELGLMVGYSSGRFG